MVRTLLFLLALVALPAVADATPHHDAHVSFDIGNRLVQVIDRIAVTGGGPLHIRLAPGAVISSMRVDGTEPQASADGVLDLGPEGKHVIELGYEFPLAPLPRGHRAMAPDPATPVAGETGAYLPAGSAWLPHIERGTFTYRISVTTAAAWKSVMPGRLTREEETPAGYYAVFDSETPQDAVPLMAGPWTIEERRHGKVLLRTYFDELTQPLAAEYLELTAGYIDLYENWIGAYPFSAFHIVAGALPVGFGYPGMTYIGAQVLRLSFIRHTSLGHETLHNWWGNGVYIDYATGNWSEGLTTFMADHTYRLRSSPEAARDMRLQWLRDYAALPSERDRPLKSFIGKTHDASQVVGYHKTAMVFHMLRDELGTDTFDAAIRRFWQEKRFKTAGWTDLRRAFEAESKRDLGTFFSQWLDRTGAPEIKLTNAWSEEGKIAFSLSQTEPAYALKVPVVITTGTGETRTSVRLEGAEGRFDLPVEGRPLKLAIDPTGDLFRHLSSAESPPILRNATLNPQTVAVAASKTARELAAAMLDVEPHFGDPVPGLPLLVIGTSVEVAALGLGPTPAVLEGRGTARAWATEQKGRPLVVVEADDEAALAAVTRPLPHYKQRGYVVFEGSKAVDKGNWPPGEGPLTAHFE